MPLTKKKSEKKKREEDRERKRKTTTDHLNVSSKDTETNQNFQQRSTGTFLTGTRDVDKTQFSSKPTCSSTRPDVSRSKINSTSTRTDVPASKTKPSSRPDVSTSKTKPVSTLSTTKPTSSSTRPDVSTSKTKPISTPSISKPTSSSTRPDVSTSTRPDVSTSKTKPRSTTSTTKPTSSSTRLHVSTSTRPDVSTSKTKPISTPSTTKPTSLSTRPDVLTSTRPDVSTSKTKPISTPSTTKPTSSSTRPDVSTSKTKPRSTPSTTKPTSSSTRPDVSTSKTKPRSTPSTTKPTSSSTRLHVSTSTRPDVSTSKTKPISTPPTTKPTSLSTRPDVLTSTRPDVSTSKTKPISTPSTTKPTSSSTRPDVSTSKTKPISTPSTTKPTSLSTRPDVSTSTRPDISTSKTKPTSTRTDIPASKSKPASTGQSTSMTTPTSTIKSKDTKTQSDVPASKTKPRSTPSTTKPISSSTRPDVSTSSRPDVSTSTRTDVPASKTKPTSRPDGSTSKTKPTSTRTDVPASKTKPTSTGQSTSMTTPTSTELCIYNTRDNKLPELNTLGISTSSLLSGGDLSIVIIDYATAVLSKQFKETNGLIPPSTIQYQYIRGSNLQDYQQIPPNVEAVQIHYIDCHYVTSHQNASTGKITIYDSLYNPNRVQNMRRQLRSVYASLKSINLSEIEYKVSQSQNCTADCGAFAIANAFLLLSKIQPQSVCLQQSQLRTHILSSLTTQNFMSFPTTSKCAQYQLSYKQMQRNNATFKAKENQMRNVTRGLKRKHSEDENTKRNAKRKIKRLDPKYTADENTKRNKSRKIKRLDTNYIADENMKRNATRKIKRLDTNYTADENTKRNASRKIKRLATNYTADENTKRNATRKIRRLDTNHTAHEYVKKNAARKIKRKNKDFRTNENSKRNKTRMKNRKDQLYKATENKKKKISKLLKPCRSTNRHKTHFTLSILQQLMYDLCKKGDEYICTCCNQTFYQHSVYLVSKESYLKGNIPDDILSNCLTGTISASSSEWICKTCHKYLLLKKIPPMSKHNGFHFPEYPEIIQRLKPTPTEQRCCSLRIPFMQIKELGIGKQYGIFGNTVNVPMNPAEVVTSLPRRMNETATIQLQFMRKTCYKRPYLNETIRPKVIYEITRHFVQTSELYKEEKVELNENWLKDFRNSDEVDYITSDTNSCFNSNEQTLNSHVDNLQDNQSIHQSSCNVTDVNLQGKSAANENKSTVEPDDWEEISEEDRVSGNCDTLLNHNDFCDDGKHALKIAPGEKSHPVSLFFDEHAEEKSFPILYCGQKRTPHTIKVSYATECKAHIRNADRRFATSTPNLFFKLKKLQTEQVKNSITVALRKRKSSTIYTAQEILDDDNVNLIVSKNEGFKILRSLRSSPAYFQEKQKDLFAMIRTLGIPTFFATFSAAETKWTDLLSLLYKKAHGKEPTETELSDLTFMDKCSLIQKDPVTCARHFQFKTHFFFNNILRTSLSPLGTLSDFYYRVEFQNRGSPHLHCLFWIENAPVYEQSENDDVIAFIDKYITCSKNTYTSADDFSYLQSHKHTNSCKKNGHKQCRFGFPIPPVRKTCILKPLPKEMDKSEVAQHKTNFNVIKNVLNDKTINLHLLTFDQFLLKCQLDDQLYLSAIRSSISRNQVFLQRDPSLVRMNGYNPDILSIWQANTDLQYILDPWAVCVYIASYLMKSQRGISKLLQKACDEAKKGNLSVRQQLKFVGNKFLNHCEISAQESIYLLLQMPLTQSSRTVMFVNTSEPENRTRILKPAHILRSLPKDSTEILCDGILQHYAQRPSILNNLTLAEFASQYDIRSHKHPSEVDIVDNTDNTVEDVQNGMHISLENGEKYLIKRQQQKILRTVRFNINKDDENYFREQLLLYQPWRTENEIKGNSQTFKEQYLRHQIGILQMKESFDKIGNELEEIMESVNEELVEEAMNEIAPNDRQEDEEANAATNFSTDFPQLLMPEQFQEHDAFEFTENSGSSNTQTLIPNRLSDQDYYKLMDSLNSQQQLFVQHVTFLVKTNKLPFRIFLSGGAGVGKSHTIKAIYQTLSKFHDSIPGNNPDHQKIFIAAPTGRAAYNVQGNTIHSLFGIRPNRSLKQYQKLSYSQLNTLRTNLSEMSILIIDEVSMVGSNMLHYLDQRLQEIFDTNETFGNISVLFVGDLFQLRPVADKWIFQIPSTPYGPLAPSFWIDHIQMFELTRIMRQKNIEYAQLLNRIREAQQTKDDIKQLEGRMVNDIYIHPTYPHLFTQNQLVDEYNQTILGNITTPTIISTAKDNVQGQVTKSQRAALLAEVKEYPTQLAQNLVYSLMLKVSAQYMIIHNVDTSDGLTNGVPCLLKSFECLPSGEPYLVWVQFEDKQIGEHLRDKMRHLYIRGINRAWIPIIKITKQFDIRRCQNISVCREQFPLKPCFGMTIHKAQGATLPTVVISFKHCFAPHTVYVAVSRSTDINGVSILHFKESQIKVDQDVVEEMKRLRQSPLPLLPLLPLNDDSSFLVLLNNSRSLHSLLNHLKPVI